MRIFRHELRRGGRPLMIWALAIGGMLATVVLIYPQMAVSMRGFGGLVNTMGVFARAFGLDRLDFTTLTGYYALETGNILGIGGAMYAGLTGIQAVAREEDGHLAEFLFSHPVTRGRVLWQKMMAVLSLVAGLHAVCALIAAAAILLIGEGASLAALLPLHLGLTLMCLQLGLMCFGLSCFFSRAAAGLGIGLPLLFYFLQLVAAITPKASWLKWLTPFGYADAATLLSRGLGWPQIAAGFALAALTAAAGMLHFGRKDLAA